MQIEALFRYPVKSMLGEEVDATRVGEQGVAGDRAYALVDEETGKIASAKNPRRWSALFACRAEYLAEPQTGTQPAPARITLADGETVDTDDPRVHEVLSRALGRPLRLENRAPDGAVYESYTPRLEGVADPGGDTVHDSPVGIVAPGTFFDAAPLHVVASATLAHLARLAPDSAFPAARFRPNIVVAVAAETGFVENEWVGHSLALGPEVSASVFLAAPRCVMTTLAQADLPRDLGVLQTIARNNRFDIPGLGPSSCVGVYAVTATGGFVRRGDAVAIT
ncbi:MAG: uncharacterized protein QOG65_1414 [Actinomycetota bacterium]|jgi:uncharacterized protein YcbX|nr:uncharacterized protein [Actinomycetota bacterium]